MDPYGVLGVAKTASEEEIKKAYRKHVLRTHPDKGGNPEDFKRVQGAYDILSDPEKRQNFDRFGSENPPQGFPGGGGFPADMFAQMFGGGGGFGFPGQRSGPKRRGNKDHEIRISFEDSYKGLSKTLRITLSKPCFTCQQKCASCEGRGVVVMQMGPMAFQQPCQACEGNGHRSLGCDACKKGKKLESLNLELKIPPGIEDGNTLTAHGLGEQPMRPDEEPGDLVFHIRIDQHPEFMRQGPDLIFQTKMSFEDSVNGKKIRIPHFDGPIDIDTADWGVIDPREDYIIPFKGFKGQGRLRVQFNVVYPHAKTRFTLTRLTETPKE